MMSVFRGTKNAHTGIVIISLFGTDTQVETALHISTHTIVYAILRMAAVHTTTHSSFAHFYA